MKKILLILLLIPIVCAQTDWYQAERTITELNVSSKIEIMEKGMSPTIESLKAEVVFLPQNSEFAAVREIKTDPPAMILTDRIKYEWKNPKIQTIKYGYTSIIETINSAPRVKTKIIHPAKYPEHTQKYTLPTKNIDITNEITEQAQKIAMGENDLFILTSKTAKWVKENIEYNLSTLTAEITQPASWVLKNKKGVCDELTSLFIAMLRSQKIPAKFISGIAYTNKDNEGWGAHGWAEVYFPGTGWVPFDITFGEYGWTDPGHIKLKESLDPQEPTTIFEWKARDADIKVEDLTLSANLIEAKGKIPSEILFSATPLRARTGFMSYNAIVLDIENLADYYTSGEFTLAKVAETTMLSPLTQAITLAPREKAKLFWIVKVKEGLNPQYQYEMPIQIYNLKNETANSAFAVGAWDIIFSQQDVETGIENLAKTQKEKLSLACSFEEDRIWTDTAKLNCIAENYEDMAAYAKICHEECQDVIIPPRGSSPVSFNIITTEPGAHETTITATTATTTKKSTLTVIRLDTPRVTIKNINAPETIEYREPFEIQFLLTRESISFPQDLTIEITGAGTTATIEAGELVNDQEITVNIKSEQLYSKRARFEIKTEYKDFFGKTYATKEEITVKINNMPWHKRLIGWLAELF